MPWKTRTLEELLAVEPNPRSGTGEMCVMVNTDEGRILATAGARVGSGLENLERCTQRYRIQEKTYLWLAGYPSGGSNSREEWPVDDVNPRVREIREGVKRFRHLM